MLQHISKDDLILIGQSYFQYNIVTASKLKEIHTKVLFWSPIQNNIQVLIIIIWNATVVIIHN